MSLWLEKIPPSERHSSIEHDNVQMRGLKFILTRSVWLLFGTALLLLVFTLGLLVYNAWRYVDRIEPIQQHLHYLNAIEMTDLALRTQLVGLLESEDEYLDPGKLDNLREQIRELLESDANLLETTPREIDQALKQLDAFDGRSRHMIDEAIYAMRIALSREFVAHQSMVVAFQAEARRGLRISIGLAAGMLVISALLWVMVRQRLLTPLYRLTNQMTLLGKRDYSELQIDNADPLLYPMIERFNHMTQRLRKLEQIHQQRHESLNAEVRSATYMLLQQQYRLAQAERLGAVGELAAGIAHELRNPLTSVQMALDNLRRDMREPEIIGRIDMITGEIRRVTRQLNQHLDQVRQRPEKPVVLDIGEEIENLVSVAAYQLHENIAIHFEVEERLTCLLPPSRLRQALLNLILNAGQILADTPSEIMIKACRKDETLELTVADTGPGFPPIVLEEGAQPFRSWRVGGTGLGLVMVRRFTSDLGGKLQLRNRDEGGACVTISVPCNQTDG
jgi:two-component system NtrC family sensor kinase